MHYKMTTADHRRRAKLLSEASRQIQQKPDTTVTVMSIVFLGAVSGIMLGCIGTPG